MPPGGLMRTAYRNPVGLQATLRRTVVALQVSPCAPRASGSCGDGGRPGLGPPRATAGLTAHLVTSETMLRGPGAAAGSLRAGSVPLTDALRGERSKARGRARGGVIAFQPGARRHRGAFRPSGPRHGTKTGAAHKSCGGYAPSGERNWQAPDPVDVDFVLNPDFTGRWDGPEGDALRDAGWVVIGGFIFNDRPVWLNRFHGLKLMHAALATGAELAWATLWHGVANQVVSPLLGLPQMPVITFAPDRHKAEGVIAWTRGRPFVWLDDLPDVAEVTARLAGDQPHLVVRVDERTGLTDENVREAQDWLGALASVRAG